MTPPSLSRARLLKTGAVALAAGTTLGVLAEPAAADAIADNDLAYVRMLVGAELLAIDFYSSALKTKQFGAVGDKLLERARFNEQEHYTALAGVLTGAGRTPLTGDDVDFAYPQGSLDSRGGIAQLAVRLETTILGAYLGAVAGVQGASLRAPIARIAASEAQHLSVFAGEAGLRSIGISFPEPLTIEQASDAMDAFAS